MNKKGDKDMEQVFYQNQQGFCLRTKKSERPQTVFTVFKLSGKQYKISVGAKCYPELWNKGRLRGKTKLDMINNSILNDKINQSRMTFNQMISYLCNCNQSDIDYDNVVSTYFTNYKTMKTMKRNDNTITSALYRALESYAKAKNISEFSANYSYYESTIKAFSTWLNDNGLDDIKQLNYNTLINYASFRQTGGKALKASTAKKNVDRLKTLAEEFYRIDNDNVFDFNASKISAVKLTENKNKTEDNEKDKNYYFTFTTGEINKLYYDKRKTLKQGLQKESLDLFMLQCVCGCRISDTVKILKAKTIYDDVNKQYHYEYQPSKGGKVAYPQVTDISEDIVKRYDKDGFKYVDVANMDKGGRLQVLRCLKTVFKNFGYSDICNSIHTHMGRYSFITNKVDEGYTYEDIKYFTGHKDTKQIEEVYDRTSRFRKMQMAVRNHNQAATTIATQATPSQPLPDVSALADKIETLATDKERLSADNKTLQMKAISSEMEADMLYQHMKEQERTKGKKGDIRHFRKAVE